LDPSLLNSKPPARLVLLLEPWGERLDKPLLEQESLAVMFLLRAALVRLSERLAPLGQDKKAETYQSLTSRFQLLPAVTKTFPKPNSPLQLQPQPLAVALDLLEEELEARQAGEAENNLHKPKRQ